MLQIGLSRNFNYLKYYLPAAPLALGASVLAGAEVFEEEVVPAVSVLPVAGVPRFCKSV